MLEATWVIVLAGGEGSRLGVLALDETGRPAPKQFCRFGADRTLLAATIARAERLVPRERVVVSVVEAHRRWWAAQLADRAPWTIASQLVPRGTAAGILLPLLRILDRDPGARVLIMPADHAVEDETILKGALQRAAAVADERPDDVVLLGVTPTRADPDLGWVLPADGDDVSLGVAAFLEKPGPLVTEWLMASGAMWNSFLVAATGNALLQLYRRHLPELLSLATLINPRWPGGRQWFEALPSRDFSRDLLAHATPCLRVVRVLACGWVDLGTPDRLMAWQAARQGADAAIEPLRRAG